MNRVSVRRASKPMRAALYPITLREPLPAIAIPLRPQDEDAVLELQALLRKAYHTGRYDGLDYARPCDPPLLGQDAEWADHLLRAAGVR
jgi:hypothetical protein